jgi:hypothetical protein
MHHLVIQRGTACWNAKDENVVTTHYWLAFVLYMYGSLKEVHANDLPQIHKSRCVKFKGH